MSFIEASISDRHARMSAPSRAGPAIGERIRSEAETSVVFAQTAANRVDLMEQLTIGSIPGKDFVITHIARKRPDHGMTDGAAKRGYYVACVHLEKLDAYDVWRDDEHESSRVLEAGVLHINDMRSAWRADIRSPFHVVNFCVPQSAFDEITSEEGGAPIAELHCPMSSCSRRHRFEKFRDGASSGARKTRPGQQAVYRPRRASCHCASGQDLRCHSVSAEIQSGWPGALAGEAGKGNVASKPVGRSQSAAVGECLSPVCWPF